MAILDDIREAFDSALAGASGLPSVVYENTPSAVDSDDTFLTTQLFFTSRRPAVRGPSPQMRYQGLYRVTVCVPQRAGTGAALTTAEAIMALFDGSTDIVGAQVTVSIEYAEMAPTFEDEPFYCFPVDIAWYIYAT